MKLVNGFLVTDIIYSYTLNCASMLFSMCFCLNDFGLIRINCALTLYIIVYRILNHRDAYLWIVTYSNHNYLDLGKASCLSEGSHVIWLIFICAV